ncbi:M14 family metallopeptidase [Sphingomicrobium aestuariivivum]|uniref:M14 family metallopeptidase n=1 Tax=Sphingomicrobium aestuariivivum TaxID=1582356 RepID=UPI001FD69E41|nr:M14-type cytosolic carboxypeptidase [Sphingomicrobium aestuariivivum]MCJ8191372.1 M14-type cytosolic carboxypeptidase [Sphingomicrobium aestuariivivum]
MTLSVTSAFDSGNIRLVSQQGDRLELEIVKDHQSDFYQWFHFKLVGGAGREVELAITNAGGAAYVDGWPGYEALMSIDREDWTRVKATSYEDGTLTIRLVPDTDCVYLAYFVPYSMDRHLDLVATVAALPDVEYRSLGKTIDGQDLDYFVMGEGDLVVWLYARQHPGESMAEWWMEGALEKLTDPDDPVSRNLLKQCTFHIVPNMNPDGSKRGHLRTNAVGTNLNREWDNPTAEKSPEVLYVRNRMDETGVDFAMDVHGDEAIPANFLAGFEGIKSITDEQYGLFKKFSSTLVTNSPDFQEQKGYEVSKPGEANLSMSTTQVAERFGAVSMTLEMPFKDNDDLPDPVYGWSTERCKYLAEACLSSLNQMLPDLKAYRGKGK